MATREETIARLQATLQAYEDGEIHSDLFAPEPSASPAPVRPPQPDPEVTGAQERAREIALRSLDGAPRTRSQLEETLARKDVSPQVAQQVLDRLEQAGIIDDAAYAAMLVRTRHSERGLARRAIAPELRRKGVDPDVVQRALAQVGAEDELEAARTVARTRARATRGLDPQVRRRRLYGVLARKGHPPATAIRVVDEVLREPEEDQQG